MTSINTNIAAQTALRTLQSTNMQLDSTQSRISTGLKIAEAKDNAAYWSISTTLRSDNKALSTVKDALSLGAATVDTAYQGLNETLSVLNEITTKLTAATGGNVDREAVQREITELQEQLKGIAKASTFSGENWLSVGANNVAAKTIVSGFTRESDGSVTLANIEVNTANIILLNATQDGLLEGARTEAGSAGAIAVAALFADNGTATTAFTGPQTLESRDVVRIAFDGAATGVIEIDQRLVNETLKVTDGKIRTTTELASVVQAALNEAGMRGVTAAKTANAETVTITGATINGVGDDYSRAGVLGIELTAAMTTSDIRSLINTVSAAASTVTASATTLGAVAKRIELQQSFVNNLMDTIDQGISGLVDADMNEESTRLQALQVKQQLGVQALSIANQSAQNVLSLFRS